LSTSVSPIVDAQNAAIPRGATVVASIAGGAAGSGSVFTQGRGFDNTSVQTISNAAGCSVANGVDSTATGTCASAGTLIGVNGATRTVVATGATAYGAQSIAQDSNTTAIGFRATAKYEGSVAIGYQAQAIADPATAVGSNSLASGNDSVALGAGARATANRSVALGAYSVADQPNTVSVGTPGSERRITNVAPGVYATDAVNVSQLYGVQQNIDNVANIAYSGVAMSFAMSGAYMPSLEAGEKALGLGVGTFQSRSAVALNFKQMGEDGKMSWGAGVSSTGDQWGMNVGVGWKWK
jgi:autotransporter adhesin